MTTAWKLDVLAAFPERRLSHWLGRKTVLFLRRAAERARPAAARKPKRFTASTFSLSLECHPTHARMDTLARLVSVADVARLELGTEWLSEPVAAANRLLAHSNPFSKSVELRGEVS